MTINAHSVLKHSFSTKKCILFVVLILILATNSLFAQEAVAKASELVNQNFVLGDYDKAYSYALFIIKYFANDTMPEETLDLVNRAVTKRSEQLVETERWNDLLDMEKDLAVAPSSIQKNTNPNVKKAYDHFAKVEAEKQKQAEEEQRLMAELKKAEQEKMEREAISAEKEADNAKIISLFEETRRLDLEREKIREQERRFSEEKEMELEKKRQESEAQYRNELTNMVEVISKTNTDAISNVSKNNKSIVWGFGVLVLLVVSVIVVVLIMVFRQQKYQNEQFKSTLNTMQAMRTVPNTLDPLPLQAPELTALPGRTPLMLGDSKMSDSVSDNASDKMVLLNLIKSCRQYGTEIDKATGRKNVSARVADLVYKISIQMGHSESESILFYAASLVYDIGFLSIDTSILRSDCLTKAQFEILQTHTTAGLNMVFFVNEENRNLFKDAVSKHHENLDGSGYPHGIKGNDIPYIARVLRVVESYIALISSCNYREIRDRNAAISELMSTPNHYDEEIVNALDTIV